MIGIIGFLTIINIYFNIIFIYIMFIYFIYKSPNQFLENNQKEKLFSIKKI